MAPNNASQRRYPPERKDPAVRMVREAIADRGGERFGAVVASPAAGHRVRHIAELEKDNRELRRPNEILKAASAFVARELDPRPPKSRDDRAQGVPLPRKMPSQRSNPRRVPTGSGFPPPNPPPNTGGFFSFRPQPPTARSSRRTRDKRLATKLAASGAQLPLYDVAARAGWGLGDLRH
jgi:transposase